MSNSLRPHGLQHARPPCPSPKPKFNGMHSFWIHRRCPGNSWKWPNSSFLIQSLAIDRRRCWVWGVSYGSSVQFSSVALSCLTLCNPMGCSMPGFPIHHQPPELTQTRVHWVGDASNHLILCHPLLLPPSVFPSIRVFSNELVLHIRWPQYWSFSCSISPSNEYSGMISFRMDWSPCSPRDSQESSPTPQFKSINSLALSFLHSPTLTYIHDYWKNNSFD